jgi:hypothetical protein
MYLSLQLANDQALEDLARFVAVTDVFERLGCVLTAYIEEDFFTTSRDLVSTGIPQLQLTCCIFGAQSERPLAMSGRWGLRRLAAAV